MGFASDRRRELAARGRGQQLGVGWGRGEEKRDRRGRLVAVEHEVLGATAGRWAADLRPADLGPADLGNVEERRRLEHRLDHRRGALVERAPRGSSVEHAQQRLDLLGRGGTSKGARGDRLDERPGASAIRGHAGDDGRVVVRHGVHRERFGGEPELVGQHRVDA